MKAFFLDQPGVAAVREIPEPQPRSGEALLRVRLVGLCGTDLSSYRGQNHMVAYPRIPGHEIAAEVEQPGATGLAPGTPVTVVPYNACGTCPACRRGRANACRDNQTLGVQRDGAMTEFIAVPAAKIVAAPGLSLRELSRVEPLSIGFHAIDRGRVTASDTVAVLGCGGVGLGAVAAAAQRGARVIAVDVDDAKLALADKAGATHAVRAGAAWQERLLALTNGDGPDVIIEAIGKAETFRAAVEEVAPTGRVVYLGYAKAPVTYDSRLFVQKELDIIGSRNATAADFAAAIRLLSEGRFPVEETVSLEARLEEAGDALRRWDQDPAGHNKILVNV
jgi:threonine dehydrogenase-like Zn-dependent dehydrogenase